MRKILATACLCLGFLSPAIAADLGSQKAPAGTVVEEPAVRNWQGFYLEGSGVMANFEVANLGQQVGMVGVGAGYDHRISNHFVVGAFVRYDFALDDADMRSLSMGARLGYLVNPHLMLYSPLAYTVDGSDISLSDGIWSIGAGLETYLMPQVTVFAEATRNISFSGTAKFLDEATTARAGFKFRF
jgi:opacity protein-like surface antigen